MVSHVRTVAFQGIEAVPVDVQVMVAPGKMMMQIVGLPDKAVAESRERVQSALHASGLSMPPKRVTVNLAPADLPKEGSHFDLPIALALLAAMEVVPADELDATTLDVAEQIAANFSGYLELLHPYLDRLAQSSQPKGLAVFGVVAVRWRQRPDAIGVVAVVAACMTLAPRVHRAIPGSLVGIALVTVLSLALPAPLARIGALPSSLPAPTLPSMDAGTIGSLLAPAVTVAALAAIELKI